MYVELFILTESFILNDLKCVLFVLDLFYFFSTCSKVTHKRGIQEEIYPRHTCICSLFLKS